MDRPEASRTGGEADPVPARYRGPVEVKVDAAVSDFVSARGGALWLRSTRRRGCRGSVTWLHASLTRPEDADRYTPVGPGLPIGVFFRASAGEPHVLEVELRGLLHRRPVALWDGCTAKI